MRNIRAYEFSDLSDKIKAEVFNRWIGNLVELELNCLETDLQKELITAKEFYEQLGCDQNYAETTGWFVPSCYYEKHKERLDRVAKKELKEAVFTEDGRFIQMIR